MPTQSQRLTNTIRERARQLASLRGETMFVVQDTPGVWGIFSIRFLDQRGIDPDSAAFVAEPNE